MPLEHIGQCAPLSQYRGVYVAHLPLNVPLRSDLYLKLLEYERDFERNPHLKARTPHSRELALELGGWRANPAQSSVAKASLREMALRFFPPGAGQKPLADHLVKLTARYASAIDRSALRICLRASGAQHQVWLDTHNDTFADYSAGLFYKGRSSLQELQAKEGLLPVHPSELPGYEGIASLFRKTAERSFVMWPMAQRHAEPLPDGGTRIAAFIFAPNSNRSPALR